MFGASLERIGGLFDQRFIVAYWSPLFVCTAVITAAFVFGHGFANTLTTWDTLSRIRELCSPNQPPEHAGVAASA